MPQTWSRPVPSIGDASSATERSADPSGWAFAPEQRDALLRVIGARRDIRRFRPDPVPEEILTELLSAAHQAPSVGHSQPWRFVVVTDPDTRAQAAVLADRARLAQAAFMDPDSGRHLLDLDLEGIREAPLGIVVCCDRRTPAAGVLGRATFQDSDLWSCACAIQNLWLSARAAGVGVGWVTLFDPGDLARLVGAPERVESLGWLCVGWPDERPPSPGLERRGWSERLPLDEVLMRERWDDTRLSPRPGSRVSMPSQTLSPASLPSDVPRVVLPSQQAVVAAHDSGDAILSAPGSLGALDRAVDKVLAVIGGAVADGGALILAAADHPVSRHGVSAYDDSVTRAVAEATVAGSSVGAIAAASSGLRVVVVDAGVEGPPIEGALCHRPASRRGDLIDQDALSPSDVATLLADGADLGRSVVASGRSDRASWLVALGEVGIANTTVAAALAAALLGADPESVVGLGAGADSAMVDRKRDVVAAALQRLSGQGAGALSLLAALGGPEIAVLAGVTRGVAEAGGVVVLDGLATSVAALVAVREEPAVAAHLVGGQRSRENGHRLVLEALGLEPLVDLRLRAGEGAGACLAAGILKAGLRIRREAARTV